MSLLLQTKIGKFFLSWCQNKIIQEVQGGEGVARSGERSGVYDLLVTNQQIYDQSVAKKTVKRCGAVF